MIRPSQALRLAHINLVLLRHGLDEVVLATHLFRPLRFLIYLSPWYWLRRDRGTYPERIRRTLEDLGPIFIKFGQILSTRRDLLPDDLANELAKLQDRVPPFPGDQARAIIEKAYGQPVGELLDVFDEQPLASASVAQVHTAQLKNGTPVVVKVLRPGIEKIIRRDVDLLFTIARLAEKYWKEGHRLRPVEVIAEYEKTIFDELDLMREAANASQLRRNFLDSKVLYVPEIYWDLARQNVLVMERIHGTPVGDVEELRRQGISMKLLGERGVEIFFTQVFQYNFFHADMHPGNIFVEPNGRYIAVDFGIMGTLTEADKRYLAENLLAFFNRDYKRVAELHVQSGWVPKSTRVEEFEAAIRTVCEPIFERPLSEISFGHFLLRLFQTARRFDMEVQPQLVLLQKTLLNIEGLGRMLYPQLDLWTTAKPFLERWMSEQIGHRALLRKMKENLPFIVEHLPDLPVQINKIVEDAAAGRLEIKWKSDELVQMQQMLRQNHRSTLSVISGSAMLLSGSLLLVFGSGALIPATATLLIGSGLGAGGALVILRGWLKSID
ncbi:MAG: ubiquinone biosynthesis regulatory protein kinase UbiB [gamma proteobacterium endosymbiont of Lamellibrachia anaximandri]|nr:ubiquinone biosynthesis regulatory protein kinase UbiB [gamma proteobacterium endosymbiont of Lamellibrachia anaximandri]MBL3532336.1 ubiquinone biosynthesis regulatory protein kinase UbiB [gamma proteobacterium endosymbiont of Lamellibrachia anaximandri]